MLGITVGALNKGMPRMQWMDDIKTLSKCFKLLVNDRENWRSLVNNVDKKREEPMFNPRRRQRLTTPLRMLPSISARITRNRKNSWISSVH
jgi:hypothetical protein